MRSSLMVLNESKMCQVSQDKSEDVRHEQVFETTVKEKKITEEAKWNGEIQAKILYFERRPVFQVAENSKERKLYHYDVREKVKFFQLFSVATPEIGTSLIYVQNVEKTNAATQVDDDLVGDDVKPIRQRRWSFDDKLLRNLGKSRPKAVRKRCITEGSRDLEKLTCNESSYQKFSDSKHSSDNSNPVWEELNENYQTYSEKSDNLLSRQISNRYNSSTFLHFSQFFLTRNGRKFSLKLTEEQPETLDFVTGPRDILWQKLPQVLKSGCLEHMTKKQILLQEALFEIIYSECRYLHSLLVLEHHFIRQLRRIPDVLTEKNFNLLFSKIHPIVKSVTIFMDDMKALLEIDEMLHGLCEIIDAHYRNSRDVYLNYAMNSESIINLYQHEISKNPKFIEAVTVLSLCQEAEKLPLDSFLSLPIQRITKLPLLLKSVITQADERSTEYKSYLKTLAMAENLAYEFNNEVGRLRECEEMLQILQELEFPHQVHLFPLATSSRKLCIRSQVKRGSSSFFHRKEHIKMFLFNDLFLFARKHCTSRGCKRYLVCEYCPRWELSIVHNTHLSPLELQLLLRVDSQGKESTLVVIFESMLERQRWVTAMTPPIGGEMKQVIVTKKYDKQRPDELNLEIGDLINIIHEKGEWCNGRRLIDEETGWFPSINCTEIKSEYIRKMNSQLCYDIIQMNNSELQAPSR